MRKFFRSWLILAAALAGAPAAAHDSFEITTDAHVSGDLLVLHTTLSLPTATRMCFVGQEALRIIDPLEFGAYQDRYEACARDFYHVTAGGVALPVSSTRTALTIEADVEMWTAYPRPTQSPLGFDAVRLRRLFAPSAGAVLTVTGARSFLGQTVLRPDAPTFAVVIGPDAEAPPATTAPPPASVRRPLVVGGVVAVVALAIVGLVRWIRRRRRRR